VQRLLQMTKPWCLWPGSEVPRVLEIPVSAAWAAPLDFLVLLLLRPVFLKFLART
jgi:hypothetical protein